MNSIIWRYAPEEIDTDAKKKNRFLNSLDGELSILMTVACTPNYQSVVDKVIVLESKLKQVANKKQKQDQHLASQQECHTSHDEHVHFGFNPHENNNHYCCSVPAL